MAYHARRVLNTEGRRWPKKMRALFLVGLLNNTVVGANLSKISRRKVSTFLDNVRALISAVEHPAGRDSEALSRRNIKALQSWVNRQLYNHRSTIVFDILGRGWSFANAIHREQIEEHAAFMSIVELAEMGLLNRIRRCACGNWIFARFIH